MSLKKSLQGITKFSDLIEFVGRDLEYENLSDQIKDKDFWNGVGSSKELLSDGREVVRITQIPEDGKEFSDIKRHLRNTGPEGRELLNIIVYTDDESKITGEVHFMYHARNPRGEKGIEYDLKYFSVNPKDVSPVYYEYLKEIKVNGRSITDLENEESDDSLLDTFSVDKITNSFYDDFHNLIQNKLEPSITDLPENVSKRHYSQLLTNRILFILFIQEKEWLSTENNSNQGQTDYLEQKYVEIKEQEDKDLWQDFFKELFFNGLSKKGSSPDIVGTVPYLNGGLFEKRDYEDEVDVDQDFFEALLSPEEVDSFGEKKGFLRNYKISLSESNPSEQELVVDPEFIGRVFEMSMQDTEERGEKGAFYTPKDITQYMSKNSIKQLLLNELPEKEEEISQLVLSHKIKDNFTEEELQTIHDELKDINVLDPAVGSGAFIIAVMEELVGIFEAINPEIGEEEDTYDLKEHMIANNLYGVDIDQAGIELCKFRTWLHLMQDLEVDLETLKKQNDKYALPNLDFKFFVGNSLSGDYKPIEAIDEIKNTDYQKTLDSDPEETNLIGKIQNKRAEFTETHNQEKKKELEEEINRLTDQLENSINWAETEYYMEDVVESSGDDFKWSIRMPEVMAEGGFDVCIMNPPYEGYGKADYVDPLRDFMTTNSDIKFFDKSDLYQLFIHRVPELTSKNGIISVITSDTFFKIKSKSDVRKKLFEKELRSIVDVNFDAFDARVWTAIFTLVNKKRISESFELVDASETSTGDYTNLLEKYQPGDLYNVSGIDEGIMKSSVQDIEIFETPFNLYEKTFDQNIFIPNSRNLEVFEKFILPISDILSQKINDKPIKEIIGNSKKIKKNKDELRRFVDENDQRIFPLGCITVGGQGMATSNNSKYLFVKDNTEYAEKIRDKESHYGYKKDDIISENKIADIENLTEKEKKDGIDKEKPHYVEYRKGSNEGRKWYDKNPFVIDWSKDRKEQLFEEGTIRNSQYYFKGGFTWSNLSIQSIKARMQPSCVFDVGSMTLSTFIEEVSNEYLVAILNSPLSNELLKNFINHTANIQVNDIRYLPVVIPSKQELKKVNSLVHEAEEIQKEVIDGKKDEEELEKVEQKIYDKIMNIYGVELDG